jgi:hypothetical protein
MNAKRAIVAAMVMLPIAATTLLAKPASAEDYGYRRFAPPVHDHHRVWIPGHWDRTPYGWRWIPGHYEYRR